MEATLPMPSAHRQPSHFHVFMQIAMMLAVITGAEIVIIFLPISDVAQYASLIALSAIKFLAVILYFMHLRWDKAFCTILFFIGLGMGGGTMFGLLLLFARDRTEAAADNQASIEAPAAAPGTPAPAPAPTAAPAPAGG